MKFRFVSLAVVGALVGVGCAPHAPAADGRPRSGAAPTVSAEKTETPADIAQAALPSIRRGRHGGFTRERLRRRRRARRDEPARRRGLRESDGGASDRREFPVIEIYNGTRNRDIVILRIDAKT